MAAAQPATRDCSRSHQAENLLSRFQPTPGRPEWCWHESTGGGKHATSLRHISREDPCCSEKTCTWLANAGLRLSRTSSSHTFGGMGHHHFTWHCHTNRIAHQYPVTSNWPTLIHGQRPSIHQPHHPSLPSQSESSTVHRMKDELKCHLTCVQQHAPPQQLEHLIK